MACIVCGPKGTSIAPSQGVSFELSNARSKFLELMDMGQVVQHSNEAVNVTRGYEDSKRTTLDRCIRNQRSAVGFSSSPNHAADPSQTISFSGGK